MKAKTKLNEIAEITMGQSPDSGSCNSLGVGLPFLQGCGEFGKITPEVLNYCTSPKKIAEPESILISIRAPVGEINLANKHFAIGRGLASIKPTKTSRAFLYYSILEFRNQLDRVSQGSTFKAISSKDLHDFEINSFERSQQHKIAHILSTADEVISQTEAAISKYQALKQGFMQDLFSRGIDPNTGQLRPSQTEAPELYQKTELGLIPKDWEVVTVQEFASDKKYAIVDGPFGSNLKSIHYRKTGIPIIQSGFVTSNVFRAESYLYVDQEKYHSEIRSSVKAGDIVMAKIGAQCGTCAILPEYHEDGIIAGNCLKITVDGKNLAAFLLNVLHIYRRVGKLELITSTTAQPAISMSSLKEMLVPRPTKNEQNQIVGKMKTVELKIQTEEAALAKYRQLKAGLMQDLLSGTVEVEGEKEVVDGYN